jgi:branched-subunit amino acid ABC-type transport system permease component
MMGWNILLPTFAAAILGGVGKIEGAVAGGLIIGIVEELSVMVIPSEYKALSAFAILLLVLLVRPRGLFKGKIL